MILFATSNPHKVEEVLAIWRTLQSQADVEADLVGLDTVAVAGDEPVEDARTFEGNASIKAAHYAHATGMLCLADDSGLEVDALGGAPGVYSARYAGVTGERAAVDRANNALLMRNLGETPTEQRTARFVCAMALHDGREGGDPDQPLAVTRGTFEGRIIGPGESPRGKNGFGYDPLFYLPDRSKTSAELPPEQKNAISHRAEAARLMWGHIQELHLPVGPPGGLVRRVGVGEGDPVAVQEGADDLVEPRDGGVVVGQRLDLPGSPR